MKRARIATAEIGVLRLVEGQGPQQARLLSGFLNDCIGEGSRVGVVEAFVADLKQPAPGFEGVRPAATGCDPERRLVLILRDRFQAALLGEQRRRKAASKGLT